MELDDTMSSTTTAIMQATKHDVFNERLFIKMLVDDVNGFHVKDPQKHTHHD